MSSIQNTVYYCCVSKGNRVLYAYSGGDPEIEKLASLCLERAPPFHTWYFQTVWKKTYGFLMEDGYVYFTIADEGLGNSGVLLFLQHVRDEFKKVAKNKKSGSRGNLSGLNSVCLQEELVPIIRQLISSLEHVSRSEDDWMNKTLQSRNLDPSPSPDGSGTANGQVEGVSSTKAPLLGKPGKQEKKKMKDRVVEIRDCGSEDHRRSTDRGIKIDMGSPESNNQGGPAVTGISLQKSSSSLRSRGSPQYARRMWWRKVQIVLAIDVAVCLILFGIWLGICHGFHCISN